MNLIEIIIGIMIVALCIGGFGYFCYYASSSSDYTCLKEYANTYCVSEGYKFNSLQNVLADFNCYEKGNERMGRIKIYHGFFFTEAEKENCKTKEAWSFKKKNKNDD